MADYHPIDLTKYPPLFQDFARYKTVIQNCSPATVEDYLSDLSLIFRVYKQLKFCPDIPLDEISLQDADAAFFAQLTRSDVYQVFNYLVTERANQACARARKLSALKTFYKYLTVTEGILSVDPVREIDAPKPPQRLPKHLTLSECMDLLSAIQADETSQTRARDFTMVTLFLNCGIRLSELCGISLRDIDRDMQTLRIIGKGNKERMIYLNDACRDALRWYIPIRNAAEENVKPAHKDALFLSTHRNQRISQKTVQYIVRKYLDAAGLENRHLSTHKLRHTAATLMYQMGGVDVRVLKDILGHEQLNTTQIYTHISDEGMRIAMEKNPLSEISVDKIAKKTKEE